MPIPALLASALISSAVPLAQMGVGAVQGARARRMGNATRPNYNIPQEILNNQRLAQGAYNTASAYGLPGQAQMEARAGRQTAASMQALQNSQMNPGAQLAGLSAIDQNARNMQESLNMKAAQYRAAEMARTRNELMGANKVLAGYQDRAFDWNKKAPYTAAMQGSSAMRYGSINNLMNGFNTLATGAAGVAARGGFNGAANPGVPGSPVAGTPEAFGSPIAGAFNQGTGLYNANYANQIQQMRSQFYWMSDPEFYQMVGSTMQGPIAPTATPMENY